MTTQVVINKFDGGIAEDLRTTLTDKSEKSLNFDILQNPHKLIPYPDTVAETYTTAKSAGVRNSFGDVLISSVVSAKTFCTIGYKDSGNVTNQLEPLVFFKATASGTWDSAGYAVGTSGEQFIIGSSIVYKTLPYCTTYVYSSTGKYYLNQVNTAGTVITRVGTTTDATGSARAYPAVRPVIHPDDNILYLGYGYHISKWDGSTYTDFSTAIPTDMDIRAQTPYGSYLAIGCSPIGYGSSTVYIWGRDVTINTFQGSVDFGEGVIRAMDTVGNTLVVIMTSPNYLSSNKDRKLYVKTYAGGEVTTVLELVVSSTLDFQYIKSKVQDRIFFAPSIDSTDSTTPATIWCVGKNKEGKIIVTQDRYTFNGQNVTNAISGLSLIGDTLWFGYADFNPNSSDNFFRRSSLGGSIQYNSTSIYKTTINPNMTIGDRYKLKQLKSVRVSFTGKASGTIVFKGSSDESTLYTFISASTTAIEDALESDTIAVASGSLHIGDPLPTGREFQFQVETTGGVEIKQIEYFYEVIPTLNS